MKIERPCVAVQKRERSKARETTTKSVKEIESERDRENKIERGGRTHTERERD